LSTVIYIFINLCGVAIDGVN